MSYKYYHSILKLVVVVFCLFVLLFDDALACRYKITKKYRMLMFNWKDQSNLGAAGTELGAQMSAHDVIKKNFYSGKNKA